MEVRIPHWASEYHDEGIVTFIAFALRVSERYGFDEWYTMSKEDLAIICNKRQSGLIEWLREIGVGTIELGDIYEHSCMFRFPKFKRGGKTKSHSQYQLTSQRQQMVWLYLVGVFNHNLLTDRPYVGTTYRPNSWHIAELKVTREAIDYIKIADRH